MDLDTQHSSGATNGRAAASTRSADVIPTDLDALLALDADTLARLYAGASVPRVDELDGDLRGRMLAIPQLPPALVAPVRKLAGSSSFPWRGKSFSSHSASEGEGVNRVFSDRFRVFKFSTFIGPSRAGAFEALQLDYDRPSNPFFIRAIKDEVRTLRPGLWLGQAWLHVRGKDHLALYFGLEKR
jgi:hypothetical protein